DAHPTTRGQRADDRAQRLRRAAAAPDHLAEVVRVHADLEQAPTALRPRPHAHVVGVFDDPADEVLERLVVHQAGSVLSAAGVSAGSVLSAAGVSAGSVGSASTEADPVAGDAEDGGDGLGGLRADAEPVLHARRVDLDERGVLLGVVLADLLDRAPVALRPGVGDDDPVLRVAHLAEALELDLHSHGRI